jgi:hypothetical protein
MLGLDKDLYSRTTIYIPGLENICKTRCVLSLINPINKMYAMLASLKKKTGIKLKYKVRNRLVKKQNKRTHEVQLHVRVYTYDFRRGVVTGN